MQLSSSHFGSFVEMKLLVWELHDMLGILAGWARDEEIPCEFQFTACLFAIFQAQVTTLSVAVSLNKIKIKTIHLAVFLKSTHTAPFKL